jgi:hypothetical protein
VGSDRITYQPSACVNHGSIWADGECLCRSAAVIDQDRGVGDLHRRRNGFLGSRKSAPQGVGLDRVTAGGNARLHPPRSSAALLRSTLCLISALLGVRTETVAEPKRTLPRVAGRSAATADVRRLSGEAGSGSRFISGIAMEQ